MNIEQSITSIAESTRSILERLERQGGGYAFSGTVAKHLLAELLKETAEFLVAIEL